MSCCNCDSFAEPGVAYYGCEHYGVCGPWWVCEHCRIAASAVRIFCDSLPRLMNRLERYAEVAEIRHAVETRSAAGALTHDVVVRAMARLCEMATEDRT